jgi:hypothetical protein
VSDAAPRSDEGAQSRASLRVRAELSIRYRAIGAAEAERLASEIAAEGGDESELPAALALRLQALERKLDLALHHLDPSQPPPLSARDLRSVGFSASGLALEAKEPLAEDAAVAVELLLPGRVPREIRALARVARCQEKRAAEPTWLVAFAFRAIRSDDREAIVRFGHELQRASLCKRSEERGAR